MEYKNVNSKYQDLLLTNQADAFSAGLGIWGREAVSTDEAPKSGDVVRVSLPRRSKYERVVKDSMIMSEQVNNEGVDFAESGDLEKAMDSWRGVLKLAPEMFGPQYNLTRALTEAGIYEEAEEQLKKLMEREGPKDARLYTLYGRVLLGQDKPDEAISMHKEALSIDSGLWEAKLNLARAYVTIGNTSRAIYEYKRALAKSPRDPNIYSSLGDLYSAQGETDKALENYSKGLQFSPEGKFSDKLKAKMEALEAGKGLSTDVLINKLYMVMVQIQVIKPTNSAKFNVAGGVRATTIETSVGAGFIINSAGEIITSANLASKNYDIKVNIYNHNLGALGQTLYPTEIIIPRRIPSVSKVPFLDFALIKITSPPSGLQPLE